ncbi:MAG: hypothetical protein IKR48_09420, partial [Kiritimatiellae bacterium]|nr:hypothetical protein [Kiritimatiellia bacterium]
MMKEMMIGFMVSVAAVAARGDTLCSGGSAAVAIDLTVGTRTTSAAETIRYSTSWDVAAPADAVAVVEVDGVELSSAAGSGSVEWMPPRNGTFTLTHRVVAGGGQIGETLTAV